MIMKVKECKNYFNEILESFASVSKKDKFKALAFCVLLGILFICPIVCLLINLFMQFLGNKVMMTILIILCGVFLHLLLSTLYPIYYLSLNELNKQNNYNDSLSFKKLFIALFTDWFMIVFIAVMVVLLTIFVNFMLF